MVEVVAALIWDKDKFLICQRPAIKARAFLWEFVGGKVEQSETKEQALMKKLSFLKSSLMKQKNFEICVAQCSEKVKGRT